MSADTPLDDLQQRFLQAITRERPVQAEDAAHTGIAASQSQTAAERLDIYRRAYFARLIEVLQAQFPCTRFAVGDEVFDDFALAYLLRHPPRGYTLDRLGDHFSEDLCATAPAGPAWGFLAELARLEHAIDRVFDGPGPESLPRFSLPQTCGGSVRLIMAPGLELQTFAFPVNAFYTQWKGGQSPPWPGESTEFVAIFRRDYRVRRLSLSSFEFTLLTLLRQGRSVETAVGEAAAAAGGDCVLSDLAAEIGRAFQTWAAAGVFTGYDGADAGGSTSTLSSAASSTGLVK